MRLTITRQIQSFTSIAILMMAVPCYSQDNRPQRREFVQGLLQTLIDSQLLPDGEPLRRAPPPARVAPVRGDGLPRATGRGEVPANALPRSGAPDTRNAARVLTQASDEMSRLVGALQADILRADGVRSLLSLAMSINADAAVLSRRLEHASDPETLRDQLRKLDQDWRTLAYRLGQTQNLSRQTLAHIQQITQYEEQLAAMFQVAPQVDMVEISRQAELATSALRTLLDDIPYEVADSNLSNQLAEEGRSVYNLSRDFVAMLRNPLTYDALRQDFLAWNQRWIGYRERLRIANNRYVHRRSQQIDDAHRSIHEMLWMEPQTDRAELLHSVRLLQDDLHRLLDRVTLKMLVDVPAARTLAVSSASDFDTACHDLEDVIVAGDESDVVRELYIYAHDEWTRMQVALQGVTDPSVRESVRDIQQELVGLQAMLGVRPDVDRQQAIELASWLSGMARKVQVDIRNTFAQPNRYSRDFQTSALTAAANFQSSAKKLYEGLVQGDKLRQLKVDCDAMVNSWKELTLQVPQFETGTQRQLNQVRRDVTARVVQLQTLLSL